MNDLINNVYLPDFKKRSVRESDAYKLLSENKKDTSVLEGYENHPDAGVVNFESFDKFLGEGGTKEEWIARHATPEVQKEFFSNVSDFLVETGKDTALSLATAVVNGADVATNLMPLFVKALDKAPLLSGMPEGFLNEATEKQVYDFANNLSNNFGEAREYLNEFKKDDNFVSQMIGVLGQDLLYSVPIYNKLRSAGMPRYPAFFISGGIGGAIGIEKEVMGAESTFSQEFFAKDIIELKNLIGILPDTPEDKIADEVVQALEYGAFSTAIPGIIDSFKFMKRYIPAFAGGAAITTMSGDDAEASPFKAIVNAVNKVPVFKSAVIDATTKLPNKGSGEQIFKTIANTPGVKTSELKWMDLEAFLKDKKNVTKEEVTKFIEENRIDISEVMFPRTGKDFGMYNEMLESAKVRQNNLFEEHFKEKGVPLDNDTYTFFNTLENGTKIPERMDFSRFRNTDVANSLESFKDVNTNIYDTDAILKTFPHKSNPNLATFYLFEDSASGQTRIFRNIDIEGDPVKYTVDNPNSGGTFEYSFQADLTVNDIKKYAAEAEIRQLERLRSLQEGTTRYERYTEPGGEDYKELLFKYKQKGLIGGDKPIPVETRVTKAGSVDEYDISESSHFGEPGELAHVRFKTRFLDDERKVLSVEEMQSDLVQGTKQFNEAAIENRRQELIQAEGTRQIQRNRFENMSDFEIDEMLKDSPPENLIKDFPFRNNWYELTLKRLIRYAADNGFDAISIPKGSVIQDRYGLTRRIDDFNISYFDEARGEVGLFARDQNGVTQIDEIYSFARIKEEFGDEVLSRVLKKGPKVDDSDDYQKIKLAKQIEIGGEGKSQLYNKTIPSFLKKYAKKWNAKVYDDNISAVPKLGEGTNKTTNIPVTVLEVTPEMKQSVQTTSQPLFELLGGVSLATWGAQAVSDNIENNIISQKTN